MLSSSNLQRIPDLYDDDLSVLFINLIWNSEKCTEKVRKHNGWPSAWHRNVRLSKKKIRQNSNHFNKSSVQSVFENVKQSKCNDLKMNRSIAWRRRWRFWYPTKSTAWNCNCSQQQKRKERINEVGAPHRCTNASISLAIVLYELSRRFGAGARSKWLENWERAIFDCCLFGFLLLRKCSRIRTNPIKISMKNDDLKRRVIHMKIRAAYTVRQSCVSFSLTIVSLGAHSLPFLFFCLSRR